MGCSLPGGAGEGVGDGLSTTVDDGRIITVGEDDAGCEDDAIVGGIGVGMVVGGGGTLVGDDVIEETTVGGGVTVRDVVVVVVVVVVGGNVDSASEEYSKN